MAPTKSVSLSSSIQASPSSPGSSGGLDSLDGSPETKVTVFSPEHVRTPNKSHRGEATTGNEPPAFTLQQTHYKLPSYMKSPKISESSPAKRSGQKAQKTTGLAYKDPFLTTDTLKANTLGTHEQKLSPTASTFTPLTEKQEHWGTGFGRLSAPSSASNTSGVGLPTPPPNVGKADSGDLSLHRFLQSLTLGPTQVTSVGQTADPLPKPEIPLLPTPPGSASSIGQELEVISALNIQNLSKQTGFQVVSGFFNLHQFPSLKGLVLVDLQSAGSIYLGFASVRDCEAAITKARTHHPEWIVEYVAPGVFVQKVLAWNKATSDQSQQVLVKAHFLGSSHSFRPTPLGQFLQELLANYGDLLDYQICDANEPDSLSVLVTYRGHAAARAAAQALEGFKIQNCQLSVTYATIKAEPHSPIRVGHSNSPPRGLAQQHHLEGVSLAPRSFIFGDHHAVYTPGIGYTRLSQTGRSSIPIDNISADWSLTGPMSPNHRGPANFFTPCFGAGRGYEENFLRPVATPFDPHGLIGQERQPTGRSYFSLTPHSSQRRSPIRVGGRADHEYNSGHHNVVDVERIRHGLDVRTTIMLRNIPNKIDQQMLKEIVDETSGGKYDFMYLRIDFANNCNVGYAFINFEDPYYIIDFVEARAGFRWNRFNSDKVAEVSYATIQGKDCLVQKFRNSSVMLEHPSFRPKIFHTGVGPLSGTEDVFLGPDNPSKMRRSVENAEHVGLFAPRAGQHNRDEQRRRRSQYDRGTRLAAMEEAYETHIRGEDFYALQSPRVVDEHRIGRRLGSFEPLH